MKYSILSGVVAALFGFAPIYAEDVVIYQAPVVQEELVAIEELVLEDEKVDTKHKANEPVACSCIQTAKIKHGVKIPQNHNAWDLYPNSEVPVVGQLILMKYKTTSHVAVIYAIEEKGYYITEGNYKSCEYTTRFIPKNYHAITGFWTADNYYATSTDLVAK